MKGSQKEIHKNYFIKNGSVLSVNKFSADDITKTTSIYEVIRIIQGVPLFLEEHLDRLNQSFRLLNYNFYIDPKDLEKEIYRLVEVNQCYAYNIKVIVNNLETPSPNIYLFFIASNYPHEEQYKKGVSAILYTAERENPNAKVVLKDFRSRVDEKIKSANAFEAILVNQHQQITEGSRSNIFLVKDSILYTAPAEKVLKGVTRNRIIDLSKKIGLAVVEAPITVDFLKECDGIFMTGTSPKVLPIALVDHLPYGSATNSTIVKIRSGYDDLIDDYIKKRS
ncbi:aminotransferase class IV [Natronincola ferrireducens]|uniref:Branched-chain amino acid aminotransferase n=1 Tax=Natronincola ferrireducens TaxID=393762 RepID=A0A1G8XQD3_9FIRM|nr:aminotransferase class IV [Natronincola ferrireducens]SDJ92687.1 branched-chain amino acid aminotransferase [Natronincola ferrireducens]